MISSEIYYNQLQQKYSRKISLGLSRVQKALKLLKEPHLKLNNPCNIIGSDGKFSCLTSLKYFIEASGKTTSTFISPHLYDLRSRIWLKNRFISLKEIKKYENKISKLNLKLSLFEVLTLIYVLAASRKDIDYSLLESGLLFFGDSTRLFKKPLLQACTNINKQHLEWISPRTINEICRQKVGYLSNESNIYIGKQKPKTLKIIKRILKKNKSRIIYPSKWRIINERKKIYYKDNNNNIIIQSNYINSKGLIDNLGLAIKIALDLKIKPTIIEKTIPKIFFEGRLQYIKKGKLRRFVHKNEKIILDGAHSNTSGKNLYNYLKTIKLPIYCIWGMQKNKFPNEFLKNFKGIFRKIITVKIPNEKNSCTVEELKKIASHQKYETESAKDFKQALKKITSKEPKLICFMGSLYFIGSVLKEN
jgi:dihydrofolate synthase / folylpolyglutamate synthase